MKTAVKPDDSKMLVVTIDPTLNRYKDKSLFPKKLALANEQLKGAKLPAKK